MTKKSPPISTDEKKIFRDAMLGVKPLKSTEKTAIIDDTPANKIKERIDIKRAQKKLTTHFLFEEKKLPDASLFEKHSDVDGETIISFAQTGLQHKRIAQLRQGKIKTEATLDLHEHTTQEALIATNNFLTRAQHRGLRAVCIIHGKGHYSVSGQPVLKNLLNTYLKQHAAVLAFHSAKRADGGGGALYVLIKSKLLSQ